LIIKKYMKLYSLSEAKNKTNNIIYNSPHSGERFPDDFLKSCLINQHILLSSGDSFVNSLFEEAKNHGSTLLVNNFARSFMDTNREAYEIDPSMFSGEIDVPLNHNSPKVQLGFGSIAKYAYTRKNIYKDKIPFEYARKRIEEYHIPIHEKLESLLVKDIDKFGYSLLVDCHSMPSFEFLGHHVPDKPQYDIILGNLYGRSCHPAITDFLSQHFLREGFSVILNTPFAGGHNTEKYNAPQLNKHAIQIEIKKSLYMDEATRTPNQYFEPIKAIMSSLCYELDKHIEELI